MLQQLTCNIDTVPSGTPLLAAARSHHQSEQPAVALQSIRLLRQSAFVQQLYTLNILLLGLAIALGKLTMHKIHQHYSITNTVIINSPSMTVDDSVNTFAPAFLRG